MALKVGEPAPPFALPLTPGEAPLRLSDYLGVRPVVLLFFPLAYSAACTKELRDFNEGLADFRELGAEVIAVSVDSPFTLRRFAAENDVRFPVVSDFNRNAAVAYDVLNPNYFGLVDVARRSVFVIGRDGRIAYAWTSPDDAPPDLGPVREAVEALRTGS